MKIPQDLQTLLTSFNPQLLTAQSSTNFLKQAKDLYQLTPLSLDEKKQINQWIDQRYLGISSSYVRDHFFSSSFSMVDFLSCCHHIAPPSQTHSYSFFLFYNLFCQHEDHWTHRLSTELSLLTHSQSLQASFYLTHFSWKTYLSYVAQFLLNLHALSFTLPSFSPYQLPFLYYFPFPNQTFPVSFFQNFFTEFMKPYENHHLSTDQWASFPSHLNFQTFITLWVLSRPSFGSHNLVESRLNQDRFIRDFKIVQDRLHQDDYFQHFYKVHFFE